MEDNRIIDNIVWLFYYAINFPEMKITCMSLTLILSVNVITMCTFPKNVEKSGIHQTHKKQNIYVGRCTPLGVPDFYYGV